MARQRVTELRVGIFVFIGILLTIMTIFMLGSTQDLFQRKYTLFTQFQSISGLRPGAPINLAGIKVGTVAEIAFPQDVAEQHVQVVLRLDRRFRDRIRADSVATIETQGLLGDKYIALSIGSPTEPVLENGGTVISKGSTSIFELSEKAGKIMDDVGEAFASFGGGKNGDLTAAIRSLRHSIEEIEKGKGLLHSVIYEKQGQQLFANLDEVSSDMKEITQSISNGEGTVGRLVRDPSLYDDMRTLLGRANRNKLLRAVIRATMRANDRQVTN